jgi:hypothetical protein
MARKRKKSIKENRGMMVLSPLDMMKLLNAICPLSNKQKSKYIKQWKALSFRQKMEYRFRDLRFWLEKHLLWWKSDDFLIPHVNETSQNPDQ